MRSKRIWGVVFGALLMLGAHTTTALAADAVRLKVSVIHASKKPAKPDPKLKKVRKQLEKVFGGYKSFRQLDFEQLDLKAGAKGEVKLPDGRSATITYKGRQKKHHRLNLAIPKSKVDVDLRALPGRMFYQAGMPHDGGILILGMYLREGKK